MQGPGGTEYDEGRPYISAIDGQGGGGPIITADHLTRDTPTPTSHTHLLLTTPTSHTHTFHPLSTIVIHTFNFAQVKSMDDNCGVGGMYGCG